MKDEKKGFAALVLGVKPKKGDEKGSDEPGMAGNRKSAAKGVMQAIEAGDAEALDEALKTHYEACAGS